MNCSRLKCIWPIVSKSLFPSAYSMCSRVSDPQGRGRSTYISDCEHKASECADRSVEIAGNESLDYCISAGHSQIIEAEWDWQDPSKVCQRKMDWKKNIQSGSNRDLSFLPSSCVDDANLMRPLTLQCSGAVGGCW